MARRRRNRIEQEAAQLRKERREMLRQRKVASERRKLMAALVPVLVLVFGFVAFGWFRLEWWQPRQPVARISGTAITADNYGKRVQFARRQTLNNLSSLMGFLQSTDPSFIENYVTGQRTNVASQTLDQMIDEELIRAEAEARGITVSDEEVDERVCGELSQATGASTSNDDAEDEASEEGSEAEDAEEEAEGGVEGDTAEEGEEPEGANEAGEDTDTAGDENEDDASTEGVDDGDSEEAAEEEEPVAAPSDELECALEGAELERAFETVLEPQLDQAGMSRRDYDELVRMQIFRDKLSESLGEELETTAEQTEVEYLLFTDESVADDASAALAAGDSWAAVSERFTRPEEPEAEDADEDATDGEAAAEAEDADEDTAETDEADEEATEDEGEATDEDADAADVEDEDTAETDEAAEDATEDEATTEGDADEGDETEEAEDEDEAPAPPPTPEPEPYAFDVSEPQWFTAEQIQTRLGFTQAEVEEAFELESGSVTEPLQGSQGFYILHIRDKDADREIDEAELQRLKDGAMDEWLSDTRLSKSSEISRFPTEGLIPAEPDWFVQGFEQLTSSLGSQAPLDLGGLDVGGGADMGGDHSP